MLITSEVGAWADFTDEAVDAAATGCYLTASFIGGLTSLADFLSVVFFDDLVNFPILIMNKVY